MSKATFVIYNKATSAILKIGTNPGRYAGMAAARAALTRFCKKSGLMPNNPLYPEYIYGIAEIEHYYTKIERTVTRKNLMTGIEYQESVNTPIYCSPASESYWSM
jgi:hypothetical protein